MFAIIFVGERGFAGDRGLPGPPGPSMGGAVYTRWGRTTCPNITGTQLVYAGRAAGGRYIYKGGGANRLCLPNDPNYLQYRSGYQTERDYLYGSEYETSGGPLSAFHNQNVPCAVCCYHQGNSTDDTRKDLLPLLLDTRVQWLPDD